MVAANPIVNRFMFAANPIVNRFMLMDRLSEEKNYNRTFSINNFQNQSKYALGLWNYD